MGHFSIRVWNLSWSGTSSKTEITNEDEEEKTDSSYQPRKFSIPSPLHHQIRHVVQKYLTGPKFTRMSVDVLVEGKGIRRDPSELLSSARTLKNCDDTFQISCNLWPPYYSSCKIRVEEKLRMVFAANEDTHFIVMKKRWKCRRWSGLRSNCSEY